MYMQIDAYMHACVSKLESKGIYVGMLVCMLACLHRFMLALSRHASAISADDLFFLCMMSR